jgi:hypothetical protein
MLHAGGTKRCVISCRPQRFLSAAADRERDRGGSELSQATALLEWIAGGGERVSWLYRGRHFVERSMEDRSATENSARRGALSDCDAQRRGLERVDRHERTHRRWTNGPRTLPERSRGLVGERRNCDRNVRSVVTSSCHVESQELGRRRHESAHRKKGNPIFAFASYRASGTSRDDRRGCLGAVRIRTGGALPAVVPALHTGDMDGSPACHAWIYVGGVRNQRGPGDRGMDDASPPRARCRGCSWRC